ncbi:reverse transcriptase ribonuclease h [Lentinula edodes]|uniref:Reverse transcriptase ribonuclease h n=1 Tax=Lentinula edodes TaxID=5353 RepID=A0A1Q3ERH0_LENED|nr:reverse transcriptase ribonuclease h [Lentinula edodes]
MLRIKYADDDQLEGLDYILFVECVNNYMRFETSRDPAGPAGTRAQFIIQHFSFFLNKRHTAKLYAFWKPAELRIRNEQYLEFTKARGGSLWDSYPFPTKTTSNTSPPYPGFSDRGYATTVGKHHHT